jgi:RNA polymerase sigma-70 factor (ECF subfamily)
MPQSELEGESSMQTTGTVTKFSVAPISAAVQADTTDRACLAAIAGGDRRAMHQLYGRHSVRVFRFVLRLTRNETLAEDLVNEVFLDVWRQAGRFEARSQVSTWILAIARNKAMSAMRRRPEEELNEDALALVADPSDDPGEILEKVERSDILRRCLEQLSPAHREIIDLVYYHEKSVEEAAVITGIPAATVKTRMFYARKQLAAMMQKAEYGRMVA